jgi:hypothetical protein
MQTRLDTLGRIITKELAHSFEAMVAADQTVECVPASWALLEVLLQVDRLPRREPVVNQEL